MGYEGIGKEAVIERVARAIADSQSPSPTMGEKWPNGIPTPYIRLAKAALDAIGYDDLTRKLKLAEEALQRSRDLMDNNWEALTDSGLENGTIGLAHHTSDLVDAALAALRDEQKGGDDGQAA